MENKWGGWGKVNAIDMKGMEMRWWWYSDRTGDGCIWCKVGVGEWVPHPSHLTCASALSCLIRSANVHATNNTSHVHLLLLTLKPFIQSLRQSQRLSTKPTTLRYKLSFGPNLNFLCPINFFHSTSNIHFLNILINHFFYFKYLSSMSLIIIIPGLYFIVISCHYS